jgi:hypothetical protein
MYMGELLGTNPATEAADAPVLSASLPPQPAAISETAAMPAASGAQGRILLPEMLGRRRMCRGPPEMVRRSDRSTVATPLWRAEAPR